MAEYIVSFHAVPKPHPDLKDYFGTWTPGHGLTSVRATSHVFRDEPSGLTAQVLYDRLKRQLNSIYGPSLSGEYIEDNATWNEDDEFLRSLLEEERYHLTRWSNEDGSKLDSGIAKIILSISADDDESCKISLIYEFANKVASGPGNEVGLSSL